MLLIMSSDTVHAYMSSAYRPQVAMPAPVYIYLYRLNCDDGLKIQLPLNNPIP